MSWKWRAWLFIEMMAIFISAPLIVYELAYTYRFPLLEVLLPLAIPFILFLFIDRSFSWLQLLKTWFSLKVALEIIFLFLILGGLLSYWAWESAPSRFLYFPNARFDLWLMIMVLYPLVSVTTQEIVYRVFFFHRYGDLFGNQRLVAILFSSCLFAFSHIIFQSWVSIAISFVGGLLFAYRYDKSRSFWAVFIEHSLYGNLIFTVGLGRYFFTGVANVG